MTNGDDEPSRQRQTASDRWDAVDTKLDRVITESREARHSQNNLFQRALHEQSESIRTEIRTEVGGMDQRLRKIEDVVTASSPISLGGRVNDIERWQARLDGETSLPSRLNLLAKEIDELKAWRDEMRGSFTFLKAAQVVVALVLGVIGLIGWAILQRPMT